MNDLPDYISEEALRRFVKDALAEDVGSGDITTEAVVDETILAEGQFLAREDGLLAGLTVAEYVFSTVDDRIRCSWKCGDGGAVRTGASFGTAHGPAQGLLVAERLVLNLMQRMSGIATLTRRFVDAVKGFPVQIMDTRKTAPGLRLLDKWAVRLGGGTNHRLGLHDMFLIKETTLPLPGAWRRRFERRTATAGNRDCPCSSRSKRVRWTRYARCSAPDARTAFCWITW